MSRRRRSVLTFTDQFCGAGGSSIGAVKAGLEGRIALNHWKRAIETHATNFPDIDHDCTDVSACDPRRYPSTDVLITSPECFPAGTLILTERGLVPIEDVVVGDSVLTHVLRWRRVTATMSQLSPTIRLRGAGHPGLAVTPDHPFLARQQGRRWNNERRDYDRTYSEQTWQKASELVAGTWRWATPVRPEPLDVPAVGGRGMPMDDERFWWLVGRWVGDGTVRLRADQGGEVTIVAGRHEEADLARRLNVWQPLHDERARFGELRWRGRSVRTAVLFECGHQGLAEWLVEHFGRLAHGKRIPAWVLSMPRAHREALLEGYVSADGHRDERRTRADTVSKHLAIGVRLLAESLGYRCCLARYAQHSRQIEGRSVQVRDVWAMSWENNRSSRESFGECGHAWSLVKHVEHGSELAEVFNLSVEEDESYVADGIVVHNCTTHSPAGGNRRNSKVQRDFFSPSADDPSMVRSRATMFDVIRFTEYHRYNLVIVENVVEVTRWDLFPDWLRMMGHLGYEYRIVSLNSMFCWPTPQSRDRVYVVFWRRGNRAPDLDITPLARCPRCEKDVASVQTWKNGRTVGKYRQQYVYSCPVCRLVITPYYYAALNAIDFSIPAERIGDRKKPLRQRTMDRIRYGLERYGRRPLYINTRQAWRDASRVKPCDEYPIGTLTQDIDWALLGPSAFITSAGSNAVAPRPVDEPIPTETATERLALVGAPFVVETAYPHSGETRAKAADSPLPTVAAQQSAALVSSFLVVQRTDMAGRGLDEAVPSLCTGEHIGLVQGRAQFAPFVYVARENVKARSMGDASPTIVASASQVGVVQGAALINLRDVLVPYGLDEPVRGLCAHGPHDALIARSPFVVSYYGSNQASPVGSPLRTVTVRDRHALVEGDIRIEDCYFRMLQPPELGRAQAFPDTYIVLGTKREQVKQYGNAVSPPAMDILIQRGIASLHPEVR